MPLGSGMTDLGSCGTPAILGDRGTGLPASWVRRAGSACRSGSIPPNHGCGFTAMAKIVVKYVDAAGLKNDTDHMMNAQRVDTVYPLDMIKRSFGRHMLGVTCVRLASTSNVPDLR